MWKNQSHIQKKSDTRLANYAYTGLTQQLLKQLANPKIEKQPITQMANIAISTKIDYAINGILTLLYESISR